MNRTLLTGHFDLYPLMQPIDAVKLLYQHAFGCGHLLPKPELATGMIETELAHTLEDSSVPAFTSIGGGLCRLNLASPKVRRLGAETIFRMMLSTEREVLRRPTNEALYEAAFKDVAWAVENGVASFSMQEWLAFLDWHKAQGRPVVSHSDAFRNAYAPHYRVVLENFIPLLPVIQKINEGRSLVVIDGPCGSGKSTLGRALAGMYGHAPIPMDDFFLPFDMRTDDRLSQPGGNVHYERFMDEVLLHLDDHPLCYNRFDCATGDLLPREVRYATVAVIEGSYSHHPFFEEVYRKRHALRVFVDVDESDQLARLQKRDPEMIGRFRSTWIPLEKKYLEAYDIQGRADVAIQSVSPLKEEDA